jgi:hypothetical protein
VVDEHGAFGAIMFDVEPIEVREGASFSLGKFKVDDNLIKINKTCKIGRSEDIAVDEEVMNEAADIWKAKNVLTSVEINALCKSPEKDRRCCVSYRGKKTDKWLHLHQLLICEKYAELRFRRRGKNETLQVLYQDIRRLFSLAHSGEPHRLVKNLPATLSLLL